VRWLDTGWISYLPFNEVMRVQPLKHSDKVEQLASPERVMHEMSLLATPDDHLGNAIVLWPLGDRKHGTIGDVAGHIGLAIANDLFAYGGP
jgi:hypothetical protein